MGRVLDEVAREREDEVAACGVALDDDVRGGEADCVHEVVVPRDSVDQRRRERVRVDVGRGGG